MYMCARVYVYGWAWACVCVYNCGQHGAGLVFWWRTNASAPGRPYKWRSSALKRRRAPAAAATPASHPYRRRAAYRTFTFGISPSTLDIPSLLLLSPFFPIFFLHFFSTLSSHARTPLVLPLLPRAHTCTEYYNTYVLLCTAGEARKHSFIRRWVYNIIVHVVDSISFNEKTPALRRRTNSGHWCTALRVYLRV